MRIFLFILILFLTNCSTMSKNSYICGERECVDKKEAKEYFKKHLSLEVKIFDKKKEKNLDLVKLNISSKNQNKKIKSKFVDKNKLLKVKKKEELEKQKKLAKIRVKEERKRIREEKKTLKSKKRKEKKLTVKKIESENTIKKKKKIKKNVNKTEKKNKFCLIMEKCDIEIGRAHV